MRHYDPDDPIWTEDEDRAAARHESYEDWAADAAGTVPLTVVGVARDDGTVVIFTTAEGTNLAVDHHSAQHLVDLLQQDGEVPVLASDWQVL